MPKQVCVKDKSGVCRNGTVKFQRRRDTSEDRQLTKRASKPVQKDQPMYSGIREWFVKDRSASVRAKGSDVLVVKGKHVAGDEFREEVAKWPKDVLDVKAAEFKAQYARDDIYANQHATLLWNLVKVHGTPNLVF